MRLSNTGNTANITASGGTIYSNDLSTNVGSGAYGTLGTGNFALTNASFLLYDGPTATAGKPMSITNSSIGVLTPGANLTLSSAISESAPGSFFQVLGPAYPNNLFATSTVTLLGNNNYSGPTYVGYQGVLATPTIANGGAASPIGTSSSDPANLVLGYAISFRGRGDLMLTGTDATYSTDRGATVRGFYNFGDGGGAIGVQNAGTALTWNGPITGPGEFIKSGAGTLVLTNTANNYQGGTVVEAGRLLISGVNGAGTIPAGSAVAIANGASTQLHRIYRCDSDRQCAGHDFQRGRHVSSFRQCYSPVLEPILVLHRLDDRFDHARNNTASARFHRAPARPSTSSATAHGPDPALTC